jgi:hypothetical protein
VAKGDFNGDGFADLAIGEPDADVGGKNAAGDVIVIYGSANGLTTTTSGVPGRQLWYEGRTPGIPEIGDHFGTALASGDFNMDGKSDLAIGIPGKTTKGGTHNGAIVVIYGSATGLTTTDHSVPSARMFDLSQSSGPAFGSVTFKPDNAGLGSSLAWGDFNGDGVGDLAAGAPTLSIKQCVLLLIPLCSDVPELGAVWEILGIQGASGGLSLSGNHVFLQSDPFSDSTVPFYQLDGHDHFGQSLAAGDFNGDTRSDLAIGSPDSTVKVGSTNLSSAGAVDVYLGNVVGLEAVIELQRNEASDGIPGALEANDRFGAALAAGDFDHDGFDDLAIGVPGEGFERTLQESNVGVVIVLRGGNFGPTSDGAMLLTQDRIFPNQVPILSLDGDQFGAALAAGDFNGDGFVDLAIGAPFDDVATNGVEHVDAGEVDVIYGSLAGLSIVGHPPQRWHQDSSGIADTAEAGDHFGSSLTAWNFGRNELKLIIGGAITLTASDLAIGVPHEDVNGVNNAGAVHVIYGSNAGNGLVSTGSQFFTGDSLGLGSQAFAHFGASMY